MPLKRADAALDAERFTHNDGNEEPRTSLETRISCSDLKPKRNSLTGRGEIRTLQPHEAPYVKHTPPMTGSAGVHPLLQLAREKPAIISGLEERVRETASLPLASWYQELGAQTPARDDDYIRKRDGVTKSGSLGNREDNLQKALFNSCSSGHDIPVPGGGTCRLVDYQVPTRLDMTIRRTRAADLVGVMLPMRSISIIELKVSGQEPSKLGDTPLRALIEGLCYSAILSAHVDKVCRGILEVHRLEVRPLIELAVLAPTDYWTKWAMSRSAGAWAEPFVELVTQLNDDVGLSIRLLAVRNGAVVVDGPNTRPRLEHLPTFDPVELS